MKRCILFFLFVIIFLVGTCSSDDDTTVSTTVTEASILATEGGDVETETKAIKEHHKSEHGKKHRRKITTTELPAAVNTTHPMLVCFSNEQRALVESIMQDHVFNGPVGFTEAFAIKYSPDSEKKQLLENLLEKYNLPPIPKCYNVSTTAAMTSPTEPSSHLLQCSDPGYRQLVRDSLLQQIHSSDAIVTRNISDIMSMFVGEEQSPEEIEAVLKAQNLSLPLECVPASEVTLSSGDTRDGVDDDEGRDDEDDGEYGGRSEKEIDECIDGLLTDPSSADVIKDFQSSMTSGDDEDLDLSPEDSRKKLKEALLQKVAPADLCTFPAKSKSKSISSDDAVSSNNEVENSPPLNSFNDLSSEEIKEGMAKLKMAVEKGYLPKDTLTKIMHGEISTEWLRNNLTNNREFIIDALPKKLQELARSGSLDEKYIKLFGSGKSQAEIESVLIEDDAFFKQFFPKILTDALQGKALPMWLKKSVLSASSNPSEASGMQDMLLKNTTLCHSLFDEVTCVFVVLFSDPRNEQLSNIMNYLLYGVLVFIMLSMGLTIEYSKLVELMKKPKGVFIAFICQFGFMPGAALCLSKIFDLKMYGALTILLIGCSPGGNISNLLAYMFDGDMNLSILMTGCSCILGIGLMPLNIFLWSRYISTTNDMIIPYDKIIISITITLIPVGIGSLIRNYKPQWVIRTRRIGFVFISLLGISVTGLSIYLFGDILIHYVPVELVYACAVLPLVGYLVGYIFARLLGENQQASRTIMIETGCQNAQLCTGILKLSFNPIQIGIYFLVPMVYMFFQVTEILIMVGFWKSFCRGTNRKYEVAEQEFEDEKDRLESNTIRKSTSSSLQMDDLSQKRKSLLQDIAEVWPLDGKPSQSCLTSFQQAKSENFV